MAKIDEVSKSIGKIESDQCYIKKSLIRIETKLDTKIEEHDIKLDVLESFKDNVIGISKFLCISVPIAIGIITFIVKFVI